MNGAICGGRQPITNKKPKNWIDVGYTIKQPYPFKWRVKIGKLECDCKECLQNYQPWYGFTYYHSDDCVLMKRLKANPQLENLACYWNLEVLAQSD